MTTRRILILHLQALFWFGASGITAAFGEESERIVFVVAFFSAAVIYDVVADICLAISKPTPSNEIRHGD